MTHSTLARLAALAALGLAMSCDSSTGSGGSITLGLSDAALAVNQNRVDTVVVTITRNDYTKDVTLSAIGLPSAVSVTFTPRVLNASTNQSLLIITVPGIATIGASTVTVKATGDGLTEQTADFSLTIGVTGSFTLASDGFPLTVASDGGGIGTVLVNRSGGHSDIVTLAASGLPAGVTASLASPALIGSATSLTLSATGATPGTYQFTITGSAQGIADQTTQASVTVISPPATTATSAPFCPETLPTWFAYQNQGYTWQSVTASSGVINFPSTNLVSVAFAYVYSSATYLYVYSTNRAELVAGAFRDCVGTKSHTGSITGLTSGQTALVAMGPSTASGTFASPSFSLSSVPSRALDLVAVKGAVSSQLIPESMLLQRNLNLASGTSLGTLDFPGAGFAPALATLTIANLFSGDSVDVETLLWTPTDSYGFVHVFQTINSSNALYSTPAAQLVAGDLHQLRLETSRAPQYASGRLHRSYFASTSDRTETLGPALTAPTASVIATSPYTRLRVQLPVQPEYPTSGEVVFLQDGGAAADRVVWLVTSAAFLGGTPASTWTFTIPEFGNVSGLNTTWLPSTSFLDYRVGADGGPNLVVFGDKPVAGDVARFAYRWESTGTVVRAGLLGPQRLRDLGPSRGVVRRR